MLSHWSCTIGNSGTRRINIKKNRSILEKIVEVLIVEETIDGNRFKELSTKLLKIWLD